MLKTAGFKLQVNCPGCNTYHALSGIHESETCQQCGRVIPLSEFFGGRLFGSADLSRYMNAYLSGNVEQFGGGDVNQAGAYKMSYSSRAAYCEECEKIADEKSIMDSIENGKPFICSCGHAMPVKPADDFVRKLHPKAIGTLNDSEGADLAEKNADEKKQMIVFGCMTCGAGLQLSAETGRMTKCPYCDNENYLPDAIWSKLHPDKEVDPFFIILDIDSSDIQGAIDYFLKIPMMKVYEKHWVNFIREYFENPFTQDALNTWFKWFLSAKDARETSFGFDIEKTQRYFYEQFGFVTEKQSTELKKIVSEHGIAIPVDIQFKLAKDTDPKVRQALARNNSIHKDIIKLLKNDADPEVAAEAKKHKTGLLGGLFG